MNANLLPTQGYLDALEGLGIETFLPLKLMAQLATNAKAQYLAARPYPHIVFDNFFDPQLLDRVLAEFPRPGQIDWQRFNNRQEVKLASASESSFGPATRLLLYHLNSITFLKFVSAVTGIENLLPDPSFEGGGLHQIVPGGKLAVHADFNKHRHYQLDRRLNLLLYLNKDWREEYGGHLELWDRSMTRCENRVLPIFNRVMIFGTTDFTYHGHPDPLRCPDGMTRKSLALYYFSNGRPAEETAGEHSTLFRARPQDQSTPSLSERLKEVGRDLVPPILLRRFRRSRS